MNKIMMSTTRNQVAKFTALLIVVTGLVLLSNLGLNSPVSAASPKTSSADLLLRSASVRYIQDMGILVFEQEVDGLAGNTVPTAVGQLDGAPVIGHVFPTTLKAEDVGFDPTDGIVALAVTSHPDFDDTPLWDENSDGVYDNDGLSFHTHWVVLVPDERVAGGLAVKQFDPEDTSVVLPPTNPEMPMYMDSPGYSVMTESNTLKILVPVQRVNGETNFNYDAVTAYMEVNTSDNSRPLLGVYDVYSILSGDLSLPYSTVSE